MLLQARQEDESPMSDQEIRDEIVTLIRFSEIRA